MARILYGVHGSLHGHAVRAVTVARRYPGHRFLFVSHGDGAALLEREFPTLRLPSLLTAFRRHGVAPLATAAGNLEVWRHDRALMARAMAALERFAPDLALCDYEHFVPRAAAQAGLPCLSVDHQHVISLFRHPLPPHRQLECFLTALLVRRFFSRASAYLVISFFTPPRAAGAVHLTPPLLRAVLPSLAPCDRGYVLAYVGKHPSEGFIRLLREIRRPVKVYGPGRQGREGNLHFRPRSESGLLEDLAGCSWAVSGGGHTFISEALYLGKPVLSYPMARAFEQYLNAFYLERLGYGRRLARLAGGAAAIGAFEGNLERFREAIGRAELLGNRAAFRVIDGFIAAAPGRSAQWGSPASSPPALPGGG